jgi:hypothetical protein
MFRPGSSTGRPSPDPESKSPTCSGLPYSRTIICVAPTDLHNKTRRCTIKPLLARCCLLFWGGPSTCSQTLINQSYTSHINRLGGGGVGGEGGRWLAVEMERWWEHVGDRSGPPDRHVGSLGTKPISKLTKKAKAPNKYQDTEK